MKKRLTALFFALLFVVISGTVMGCTPDSPPNTGSNFSYSSVDSNSSMESSSSHDESTSSDKKNDLGLDEYENDGGWMN